MTSRLGSGKIDNLFYSVVTIPVKASMYTCLHESSKTTREERGKLLSLSQLTGEGPGKDLNKTIAKESGTRSIYSPPPHPPPSSPPRESFSTALISFSEMDTLYTGRRATDSLRIGFVGHCHQIMLIIYRTTKKHPHDFKQHLSLLRPVRKFVFTI